MAFKDYDIPWQAAEGTVGITKKLLFAMALIIFAVIAGVTLNILDKANMGINTCSFEKEDVPAYDYNMRVLSRTLAESMIEKHVGEARFAGNSLEPCGSVFLFEALSDGTKYMVCETGAIYRMAKVCRKVGVASRSKLPGGCANAESDPKRCINAY